MRRILSDEALDILFRTGRSPEAWLDRPVSDTLLRAVWELAKLDPAHSQGLPLRIVFLRSAEAKERLLPALPPEARAAGSNAPVVAILGAGPPAETGWTGTEARARVAPDGASRAACLILAARALALDCQPICEFDAATIEGAFFPKGEAVAVFLCGLGYGEGAGTKATPPAAAFDGTCGFL